MQTADIEAMQEQVVLDNDNALTDLNREQLLMGLTSKGATIAPSLASFVYAKNKKERGGRAPFGVPDMRNTGAFQREMQIDVDSGGYSFFSTDEKAAMLNEKYRDLFGLTVANIKRARNICTAALAVMYKKYLGL